MWILLLFASMGVLALGLAWPRLCPRLSGWRISDGSCMGISKCVRLWLWRVLGLPRRFKICRWARWGGKRRYCPGKVGRFGAKRLHFLESDWPLFAAKRPETVSAMVLERRSSIKGLHCLCNRRASVTQAEKIDREENLRHLIDKMLVLKG